MSSAASSGVRQPTGRSFRDQDMVMEEAIPKPVIIPSSAALHTLTFTPINSTTWPCASGGGEWPGFDHPFPCVPDGMSLDAECTWRVTPNVLPLCVRRPRASGSGQKEGQGSAA